MNIRLAYSPCPNDTFMFYALAHQKVNMRGLSFDIELMDVEQLNERAVNHPFDVSKMSFHAYALINDFWEMCDAGAALGRGNGPLLVCNKNALLDLNFGCVHVMLPGRHTTAALLMRYAFPHIKQYSYCIFNEVEQKILNREAQAGVLIHETRFLYADHGLELLADLGEMWEKSTGLPIPLGGIAMQKSLPEEVRARFSEVMKDSVSYALAHPDETMAYVREHAQEMDMTVMRKHIAMFVNEYSVSMGLEGRRAVEKLCEVVKKM